MRRRQHHVVDQLHRNCVRVRREGVQQGVGQLHRVVELPQQQLQRLDD
jgi:hypothetical protein